MIENWFRFITIYNFVKHSIVKCHQKHNIYNLFYSTVVPKVSFNEQKSLRKNIYVYIISYLSNYSVSTSIKNHSS
jgi:hypothetical protein